MVVGGRGAGAVAWRRRSGGCLEELVVGLPKEVSVMMLSATMGGDLGDVGGWLKEVRGGVEVVEDKER